MSDVEDVRVGVWGEILKTRCSDLVSEMGQMRKGFKSFQN